MYRTMTLIALRNNIDLEDEKSILEIAKKSELQINSRAGNENDYTSVKFGEGVLADFLLPLMKRPLKIRIGVTP